MGRSGMIAAMAMIMAVMLATGAATGASAAGDGQSVGPESKRPLPRFVSLKAEKANVRRGPGLTHRIDWVFLRRGMPLEVVAEYGQWRKVRDVDDAGGWIHHAMLRPRRSVVVTAPRSALRAAPGQDKRIVAIAEAGVIADLDRCDAAWCEVEADERTGWVPKADIWGADANEVFE